MLDGMKRRPLGITIISLMLGYLSIAGFANAVIMAKGVFLPIVPVWFSIVALAYGATAFGACRALWKRRNNTVVWLRAWFVVLISAFSGVLKFFAQSPEIEVPIGLTEIVVFTVFLVVLLYAIDNYVRRYVATI